MGLYGLTSTMLLFPRAPDVIPCCLYNNEHHQNVVLLLFLLLCRHPDLPHQQNHPSLSPNLPISQALEPASLIPLQFAAPTAPLILVGDPQQLPATVLSSAALRRGLDQSLFVRLQDSLPVTMLREQYRMHPAIAAFPAAHFYSGDLENAAGVLHGCRDAPYHR